MFCWYCPFYLYCNSWLLRLCIHSLFKFLLWIVVFVLYVKMSVSKNRLMITALLCREEFWERQYNFIYWCIIHYKSASSHIKAHMAWWNLAHNLHLRPFLWIGVIWGILWVSEGLCILVNGFYCISLVKKKKERWKRRENMQCCVFAVNACSLI